MNNYPESVLNCRLFEDLSPAEIGAVMSETPHSVRNYEKEELIRMAGSKADSLGIVIVGVIELRNNLESGKYFNILYRKEGDTFGAPSMFGRGGASLFEICTKTDCSILYIRKSDLSGLLRRDERVNSNILSIMSDTVSMLNKKLELFSDSSIQKKIAFSLLYNSEFRKSRTVEFLFSKQSWAEHLNVSRPSLSRELRNMEDEGIISLSGREITILDREKLEQIISF